jgi:urease accessory protein
VTETSVNCPDLAWCSPADLPDEIVAFDSCLEGGLPVGASGKLGVLNLALSTDGRRTRVQRQYQRAPLYVYRPVYLDPARPDMAFIFIQQSGDGLVQGDRDRVDISCGPGSATHITTQAATKIFAARQNFTSQLINLRADERTILEYLPDPTVPYRGSRFFQRTRLTVHPESTVILGETVLPGRVARGEKHLYSLYWSETEVQTDGGDLLFRDVLRLNPGGDAHPNSIAVLGDYDVIAALYIITMKTNLKHLLELLRAALGGCPEVLAGVSALPNACGLGIRLLGPTSATVQAALLTGWTAARLALLGGPPPDLRKG